MYLISEPAERMLTPRSASLLSMSSTGFTRPPLGPDTFPTRPPPALWAAPSLSCGKHNPPPDEGKKLLFPWTRDIPQSLTTHTRLLSPLFLPLQTRDGGKRATSDTKLLLDHNLVSGRIVSRVHEQTYRENICLIWGALCPSMSGLMNKHIVKQTYRVPVYVRTDEQTHLEAYRPYFNDHITNHQSPINASFSVPLTPFSPGQHMFTNTS